MSRNISEKSDFFTEFLKGSLMNKWKSESQSNKDIDLRLMIDDF